MQRVAPRAGIREIRTWAGHTLSSTYVAALTIHLVRFVNVSDAEEAAVVAPLFSRISGWLAVPLHDDENALFSAIPR